MTEALIQVLECRFPGQVPADLMAVIRSTSDSDDLEDWIRQAMQASSVQEFHGRERQLDDTRQMPLYTFIEEMARARGRADAVIQILEQRFPGQVPANLRVKIRCTSNLAQLEQWIDSALQVSAPEKLCRRPYTWPGPE